MQSYFRINCALEWSFFRRARARDPQKPKKYTFFHNEHPKTRKPEKPGKKPPGAGALNYWRFRKEGFRVSLFSCTGTARAGKDVF